MIELHREPDGVAQAVEDAIRAGASAAAALGKQLAAHRAQQAREAQARGRQTQAEYKARLEVERQAMHAKLAPVSDPVWWKKAEPQEILDAWTTSLQWGHLDARASRTATHIRSEFETRYGVDLRDLDRHDSAGLELPPELPNPIAAAVRDYHDARQTVNASGQTDVEEMVAAGGPKHTPRPRRSRGRSARSGERERTR